MTKVSRELRDLLPAWAVLVLLPVPVATFWNVGAGRDFTYSYLFLACALLTAEQFGRPAAVGAGIRPTGRTIRDWRAKMTALVLAVVGAAGVLTTFVWAMTGQIDATIPLFAVLAVLPAVGCVPFVAIKTGQPYLAVLFAIVLLTAIKLAGCLVVVLIYGWNSQAEGRLTLPWERPNLLVWLCLGGASVSSAVLYWLGRRAFLKGECALS
jgi:hypothetical protein